MKLRLAAALLAVPLLAFDCGGEERPQGNPLGTTCTLRVRGAATEDLWCIAAAYDYSDLDPTNTLWALDLVAYRGMAEVGAGVGLFHEGRPALGTAYGWSGAGSNVDSGGALRYVGQVATHEAESPLLGVGGSGELSVTFSRIPPPGATGPQLMDVHGVLSGTLPAADGVSPPVTFWATF